MPEKLTIEYIKNEFKNRGLHLLTTVYINNRTKLVYKCKYGKFHTTNWINWSRSKSKICKCERSINLRNIQYDKLKKIIEEKGGTLLSCKEQYINNKVKIIYICNNKHVNNVIPENIFKGHWCRKCADLSHSNNMLGDKNFNFKNGAKKLNLAAYETYAERLINAGYVVYKVIKYGVCVVSMKCTYCNKNIIPKRCTVINILKTNKKVFCSNSCSGKYFSSLRNLCGENNPNWRGGKSTEPYCPVWSDKEYKIYIRKRDNNICQNPYCFHTTKKLSIHHIDYNKKNCHPSNLITLCVSCNSRANKDRSWHQKWYQTLMNKKLK